MGIDLTQAPLTTLLDSTKTYQTTLSLITRNAGVWMHLGALATLQYLVAREMEIMREGLNNTRKLKKLFNQETGEGYRNGFYVREHARDDLPVHFNRFLDGFLFDIQTASESGAQDINAVLKDIKMVLRS